MKAIGSQAAVKQQTRYKFNAGTELEDNFDVNYYETYFRQYDAQIGRFTGVDVLAEKTIGISTYQFGNNNPVLFNAPTGLQIDASPRGPAENWNPNLRIYPKWYTDSWDAYWSDPYNIFGPGGSNPNGAYADFWKQALSLSDFGLGFINKDYINNDYTTERFWYSNGIDAVFNTAEFHNNVTFTEGEYYLYLGKTEPHAQQSDRNGQLNENYDWNNAKNTLDVLGGVFGALETTVRPGDMWLGKNGKYYNIRWGGNQYTGSRSGAFKAAGTYKWAGQGVVATSVIIGGIEVYNGYKMDGNHFGYNAQLATGSNVGGLIGGWFGGQAGSYIGEQSVNYYYGK